MKKYFILFVIAISMIACSNKQTPINDLADLANELQEAPASYTQENWEKAARELELIEEELSQYQSEYTDNELREIGRLKGICVAAFTKHSINTFTGEVENMMKQAEGFWEGFTKEIEDSED